MDATALAALSRPELVDVARANEIDTELASDDIVVALMKRFPLGFVPYLPGRTRRRSSISKFVGRVKKALKTLPIRRTSVVDAKALSPLSEGPAAFGSEQADRDDGSVRDETWSTGLNPNVSYGSDAIRISAPDVGEEDEPEPELDPEGVKVLVEDMIRLSQVNQANLARAAVVQREADRLKKLTRRAKEQLVVEQTRRKRAEDYYHYWRAQDPRWSHTALWEGKITLAPVVVRIPGAKGSFVKDMEVDEEDDAALRREWKRQHRFFEERCESARRRKAAERNVPVEMVSDVETSDESDLEEFYHPFVLHRTTDAGHGDQDVSESELYVYPMMGHAMGRLFERPETEVIVQHGRRKRGLDDGGECREESSSKRVRREQVSVTIPGVEESKSEHDRRVLGVLGLALAPGESELGEGKGWLVGPRFG